MTGSVVKSRKLVPVKAQPKAKTYVVPTAQKRKSKGADGASNSRAVKDYARLLFDPCNAPIAPGMIGNGSGTNIARFETDFTVLTGVSDTTINLAVSPMQQAIWQGTTTTDIVNITWASSNPFPGAARIANAAKIRPLACCLQMSWVGAEQSRQGVVAMGNGIMKGASPASGTITPAELRSAMPYVFRMPDQQVGIKWRPTETDLEWRPAGTSNSRETVLWASVGGIPASTAVRFRITVVLEWEDDIAVGSGAIIQQYPRNSSDGQDVWQKAMTLLDKTGHWLLDNGAALGHTVANVFNLLI